MDIIFIILLVILCVLIAFYIRSRNLKAGGYVSHRVIGGGKEIEARWLDVDVDEMRKKIEELGGELVHDEKQYRRYTFNLAENTKDVEIKDGSLKVDTIVIKTKNSEKDCKEFVKAIRSHGNGFARTREEYHGNNIVVTMTCKIYGEGKHADEYEVETENTLDECREFLLTVGLQQKAYHETRRIKYKSKGNELTIDTVPGMPPYVGARLEELRLLLVDRGLLNGTTDLAIPGSFEGHEAGALFNYKYVQDDFSRGVHNFKYANALLVNSIAAMQ